MNLNLIVITLSIFSALAFGSAAAYQLSREALMLPVIIGGGVSIALQVIALALGTWTADDSKTSAEGIVTRYFAVIALLMSAVLLAGLLMPQLLGNESSTPLFIGVTLAIVSALQLFVQLTLPKLQASDAQASQTQTSDAR